MALATSVPTPEKRLRPLSSAPADGLVIHEIYASVQGESTYAGVPCTFVRTTACNLRCTYCDTPHAFTQGEAMSLAAILARVAELTPRTVEITGGEPLLQANVLPLMTRLCDAGYRVLLETGGSIDITPVDPRVVRIVDFKAPSSGELAANYWPNVAALRPHDEVKLVLGDRADYEWAKRVIAEHELARRCTVLLGAVFGALAPRDLVAWINADALPVRLNVQLHKYVWEPAQRGV